MRVAALVDDLLDRSRVSAALPGTTFVRDPAALPPADVVIVDLAAHAADLPAVRAARPDARVVGFAPHVDRDALAAAGPAGADVAVPRSQFFRDPAAAVAAHPGAVPPSPGAARGGDRGR